MGLPVGVNIQGPHMPYVQGPRMPYIDTPRIPGVDLPGGGHMYVNTPNIQPSIPQPSIPQPSIPSGNASFSPKAPGSSNNTLLFVIIGLLGLLLGVVLVLFLKK